VTNPRVVVEVLSTSTEEYDRGEKREHYQQIEALREYVLIAQIALAWRSKRPGFGRLVIARG